jgi:hypothetical protein
MGIVSDILSRMGSFEKTPDPSLRYDDRDVNVGAEVDKYDTSHLERDARTALISGLTKYSTLAELIDAQTEALKIATEHPLLEPMIGAHMDRRALEIINNRLLIIKDENDLGAFLTEAKNFPFYSHAAKLEAYQRLDRFADGMRTV